MLIIKVPPARRLLLVVRLILQILAVLFQRGAEGAGAGDGTADRGAPRKRCLILASPATAVKLLFWPMLLRTQALKDCEKTDLRGNSSLTPHFIFR